MVFIYSSLHLLERVRRKAPARAWCYLSIELFAVILNLTDSSWLVLDPLWTAYLLVVAEAVRVSLPNRVPEPVQVPVQARGYLAGRRSSRAIKLGDATP
jgi:hypothetical protein